MLAGITGSAIWMASMAAFVIIGHGEWRRSLTQPQGQQQHELGRM
jgi:hypothetical protein